MSEGSGGRGKQFFLDYFKELWKGGGKGSRKNYFLLVLLLAGILLMVAGSFFAPVKKAPADKEQSAGAVKDAAVESDRDEKVLGETLQQVLENIDGIGRVQIFVNFDGSSEALYARANEASSRQTVEQDSEGGTRETLETSSKEDYVLLREAGGGEAPLLLAENLPKIKGILVVAGGVENSALRLQVVRAIQSALNLPVHRIAVLPFRESKN